MIETFLASLLFAANNRVKVCAVVTTDDNLSLPGVEVQVQVRSYSGNMKLTTDNQGRACVDLPYVGRVQLRVEGSALGQAAEVDACIGESDITIPLVLNQPPEGLVADCAWSSAGPPTAFDLKGSVHDAAGHPIPGAKLLVMNRFTKEWTSVKTGRNGAYSFRSLPFSSYDLTVTAPGFIARVIHFREDACAGGPFPVNVEMYRPCPAP